MHAYPYDEHMSTFIVECPDSVWRAAGLDAMDEDESRGFCEQLFADDLRGREPFTNRSVWLDFPKVTNRVWHDGRVVLVGDAAHTAHFSIGSGTKLAMEDSIALAQGRSVGAGTSTRRSSTTSSSAGRRSSAPRPRPARALPTSGASARTRTAPVQFAFNLLTRAGRITHASLSIRDPDFTRDIDS